MVRRQRESISIIILQICSDEERKEGEGFRGRKKGESIITLILQLCCDEEGRCRGKFGVFLFFILSRGV